jgi:hypothetical protein
MNFEFDPAQLKSMPCANVPLSSFFSTYDLDNNYQLAVMCKLRQDNDSQIGLWLTGPKRFILFELGLGGGNAPVIQLPLTLADIKLELPLEQSRDPDHDQVLGRVFVHRNMTTMVVGWPPRAEGRAPEWKSLTLDGLIAQAVNSELSFDRWSFVYKGADHKKATILSKAD